MVGMDRSGGTRVLFEVANRLATRGHEISFTSLGRKDAHRWFPLRVKVNYIETTVPIVRRTLPHILDYALRKTTPWRLDRIRNLGLALPDCDISVATSFLTAFAVHRSGRGTPFYYVQHHEPLFFNDPYTRRNAQETYYLPLHIITVSSWLKDLMKKKYSKDSKVVLNGVDRKVFFPRPTTKDAKMKRVVCIGRDLEWKGLNDLTQAMKIVHNEYPPVELIIVTQDKLAIGETGFPYRIVCAPTDEELATQYSSSDIFVSPSWYEGFSLPPLEAMSCGTPVVTTRIGPEDYAADGENALIVEPRKPKQMAVAILSILNNPNLRDKLVSNGIETAKKLTWDETASKVEAALLRMASGK